MSDNYAGPFLGRIQPRVPLNAERLWELQRDGKRARAGIVYHTDPIGFEFQLYVAGFFIEGRRFAHKEVAIDYGEKARGEYKQDGWN